MHVASTVFRGRVQRVVAACVAACCATFGVVATASPAAAATCYTWSHTLRPGANDPSVAQLQIRVAGWADDRDPLTVDGRYGSDTTGAVKRFQKAYGLPSDGIAGPRTFAKIYQLQDSDCTPIHFSYREFMSHDGKGFSGGKVSAAKVKQNVLRVMWKAEALRHKLGDHPLTVVSGFRSISHNRSVGGAANSQHLYGTAVDLSGSRGVGLCTIARVARTSGFSGILGPGAEGHSDHTHVDSRLENKNDGMTDRIYWNAPNCF